jgi:acetyl esterase/lipase
MIWLRCLAALGLLFLTSWILLPAPVLPLLALAIATPEVSAWLVLAGLVLLVFALRAEGRSRIARLTVVVSALAVVLATTPFVRLPFAVQRFDAAMRAGLGDDFLEKVPRERREGMRGSPVIVRDLFRGLSTGRVRVTHGIPFAAPEGDPLTLRVYQPMASGRYPSIVQIYGGAWQGGSPSSSATFASYLAAHGYVVFAIDYRHAPRWQWPAQLADVRSAMAWIRLHAAEYDGDPSRVAVVGRSSGAQLALLLAYEHGSLPVVAVVDYYGPTDLAEGYRHPPRPDPFHVRTILETFLAGTPDTVPDRYREASPIAHLTPPLPPSLLIYGARDHIVESRFGVMLDARLREVGATSVFLEIPWAEHAFDLVPNGPSGQVSLYYTERFLAWAFARR